MGQAQRLEKSCSYQVRYDCPLLGRTTPGTEFTQGESVDEMIKIKADLVSLGFSAVATEATILSKYKVK